MNKPRPINLAASVRQRLLNQSKQRHEDFNLILTCYANERFLYRLAQSRYADQFILKGAQLFAVWKEPGHRPTRDLDLLGFGDSAPESLASVFQEVCNLDVEADGVVFDPASLRVTEIREQQAYPGQRVQLLATLDTARIQLQIDIGFGDIVTPEPELVEFPTLLDSPAPRLRTYPPETVIAEKLQAMVVFGILSSRMKDLHDLWTISGRFSFEGKTLAQAIRSTFQRRRTGIPRMPVALTAEFSGSPDKNAQWRAFLQRNRLEPSDVSLAQIIEELRSFLIPVLSAIPEEHLFDARWSPGGPWVT